LTRARPPPVALRPLRVGGSLGLASGGARLRDLEVGRDLDVVAGGQAPAFGLGLRIGIWLHPLPRLPGHARLPAGADRRGRSPTPVDCATPPGWAQRGVSCCLDCLYCRASRTACTVERPACCHSWLGGPDLSPRVRPRRSPRLGALVARREADEGALA